MESSALGGRTILVVEAEPLVDRAFVSMMASLEEKFGEQTA